MKRFGYISSVIEFDDLLKVCDKKFFDKICTVSHCLNHLLPSVKNGDMFLRARGHNYCLPSGYSLLHKNSFVYRILFNFV